MGLYEQSQERMRLDQEAANNNQGQANQLGVSIFGTPDQKAAELAARQNAQLYYGNSKDIGAEAANYRGLIKSKLGQSSALANRMTQVSNQELSRADAQVAGAASPAARIKARRDAIAKANEIGQSEERQNLANYGKSIGAGISGTESLAAAGSGRGLASTPTPTPQYGGGPFGSIICTELYRQGKLSLNDLVGCRTFGHSLQDEEYFGYLIIAKPIVWTMKKSSSFSNLFIGWAKALSANNPSNFTKFMIPICGIIGKLAIGVRNVKRA